jgi:alpha-acetolactate decarboxylase
LYQRLINAPTYGESGFGYWDNKLDGECVGVLQTFYHKAKDALGREFLVNQRLTKAVTVQFVWMRLVELQQVTILNTESKYAKLQEGMGSYTVSISQASRVNIFLNTPSTHMLYSFSRELSKGTFSFYSI